MEDRISYFLRREEDRKGRRGERKRGKGSGVQTDLGKRGGDTLGTTTTKNSNSYLESLKIT